MPSRVVKGMADGAFLSVRVCLCACILFNKRYWSVPMWTCVCVLYHWSCSSPSSSVWRLQLWGDAQRAHPALTAERGQRAGGCVCVSVCVPRSPSNWWLLRGCGTVGQSSREATVQPPLTPVRHEAKRRDTQRHASTHTCALTHRNARVHLQGLYLP